MGRQSILCLLHSQILKNDSIASKIKPNLLACYLPQPLLHHSHQTQLRRKLRPTLAFRTYSVNFTFRLQVISFVLLTLQGTAGRLLSLGLGDLGWGGPSRLQRGQLELEGCGRREETHQPDWVRLLDRGVGEDCWTCFPRTQHPAPRLCLTPHMGSSVRERNQVTFWTTVLRDASA